MLVRCFFLLTFALSRHFPFKVIKYLLRFDARHIFQFRLYFFPYLTVSGYLKMCQKYQILFGQSLSRENLLPASNTYTYICTKRESIWPKISFYSVEWSAIFFPYRNRFHIYIYFFPLDYVDVINIIYAQKAYTCVYFGKAIPNQMEKNKNECKEIWRERAKAKRRKAK